MEEITAPHLDGSHPDYPLECEKALDNCIDELIDHAVQAGWETRIAINAITALSIAKGLGYEDDPNTRDAPSETELVAEALKQGSAA